MQEFLAGADAVLRFGPFINESTGAESTGGTDTLTVTLVKPNDTVVDGDALTTPAVKAQHASSDMWSVTIAVATDYMVGDWQVKVASNLANSKPFRCLLRWGVGTRQDANAITAPGATTVYTGGVAGNVKRLHDLRMGRKRIDRAAMELRTYSDSWDSGNSPLFVEALLDQTGTDADPSIVPTIGTLDELDVHETGAVAVAD